MTAADFARDFLSAGGVVPLFVVEHKELLMRMQHLNRECLMITFIETLNTHGMITAIRSSLDHQFEAYRIGLSENLKQWRSWVGKSAKRGLIYQNKPSCSIARSMVGKNSIFHLI
jgi:hypothetical protein